MCGAKIEKTTGPPGSVTPMPKGPPGWSVDRAPDGSLRVAETTRRRLLRHSIGLPIAALFILVLGAFILGSVEALAGRNLPIGGLFDHPFLAELRRGLATEMPHWWLVVMLLWLVPTQACLLLSSVWMILGSEEWRISRGTLQVRRRILFFTWVRQYTSGGFTLIGIRDTESYNFLDSIRPRART